ncbi:related to host-specific AK-toxin Akt2 [Cephalotrichum gorgonifer]|uniref:Related to host-specific AK-toxin Akt2 n=1 Tax=Cephalotrichum gorgonifer TaxID=2041049 RepID=A0AAE8SXL5_9PEZI|nr:related to host-specific AK-toxin Akt2 [Cephalotrichum gorgonifer]
MTSPFVVREHVVPGAHIREYARATADAQEEVLEIAVKEYIPREEVGGSSKGAGGVTILGAHANGFPKELYEPLWEDLYRESKKRGFRIRSIIIADAAWQGKSGLLNASKLGNDPSWLDYTRDIAQVINHLRPPLPMIGISHSFGAAALVNLAHTHPRLLTSLVLLDPVISPYSSTPGPLNRSPAAQSLRRREVWPSRPEARAKFNQSPFYKAWDTRVLDRWVEFGLRDVAPGELPSITGNEGDRGKGGEVTLTTTKHQEDFTFLRPTVAAYDAAGQRLVRPDLVPDLPPDNPLGNYPFYRPEPSLTLSRLPSLRPGVLYVLGETSNVSDPVITRDRERVTGTGRGGSGGRMRSVTLKGRGHLIPMEVPGECAALAAEWMGEELGRWARGEGAEFEEWRARDAREKTRLGPEWYELLKREKAKI